MSSITITELAERCGDAVSTVSRAMNERTGISPRTRERILQVARETGAAFGGILYVDSLSAGDGPVPSYLDLLKVTTETIARGLTPAK